MKKRLAKKVYKRIYTTLNPNNESTKGLKDAIIWWMEFNNITIKEWMFKINKTKRFCMWLKKLKTQMLYK